MQIKTTIKYHLTPVRLAKYVVQDYMYAGVYYPLQFTRCHHTHSLISASQKLCLMGRDKITTTNL